MGVNLYLFLDTNSSQYIVIYLKRKKFINISGCSDNPAEVLDFISKTFPDIILIDDSGFGKNAFNNFIDTLQLTSPE
ncbi:MAG: hypothetical protein R6W90_12955 [Ignavibacteriaceae bacterium]